MNDEQLTMYQYCLLTLNLNSDQAEQVIKLNGFPVIINPNLSMYRELEADTPIIVEAHEI